MDQVSSRQLLYAGAALSLAAGIVHAFVIREHLDEWWGYGVFFIVVTIAQVFYAAILLQRPTRWVLIAGIAGNLALIAMWAVTRTLGIPLVGPEAGEVEAIGQPDLLAKLAEALLVVALGILLAREPAPRDATGT